MKNVLDIVVVNNLVKQFGDFTAVDNISFSLKKGEILGLLGPNGAGKTTTIQMLLGILSPTSGTISYFGKDIQKNREEIMEQVNFSSTYTHLPWRLTPRECLNYTSYFYDIKNRNKRIDELLAIFKLTEHQHKENTALSSGQLTRLNLAKAFINKPDVLLLDEPTASLDPDTAHEVRQYILKQQKDREISVLFTSHNMNEVEEVCDRVLVINNGKVVAQDSPENLPKLIKNTTLELRMIDGLKRTVELCKSLHKDYVVLRRAIEITLEESEVADFLHMLAQKGITYDQISINKPTLEDFFMSIVKEGRKSSQLKANS